MLSQISKNDLLHAKPFKYLTDTELDGLLGYCQKISFSAGNVLIRQGVKSEGMYIIIEGKALVTVRILGKDILNLAILEPGNFIGEASLIEKCPANATVIADTNLQCLLITANYFDMLSVFYPEIKYKITKAITEEICSRIKKIQHKITDMMSSSDITTRSFFTDIMNSFAKPEIITFSDAHINQHKLQKADFFKDFTPDECDMIFTHSELVKTPTNCTLIKAHEESPAYYLVIFGAVQVSIINNNKSTKLAVLGPMSIISSTFHIDSQSSNMMFTTCERAVLLKTSPENIQLLQKNYPLLWYKIFDYLCKSYTYLEKSSDKLDVRLHCELYNR